MIGWLMGSENIRKLEKQKLWGIAKEQKMKIMRKGIDGKMRCPPQVLVGGCLYVLLFSR